MHHRKQQLVQLRKLQGQSCNKKKKITWNRHVQGLYDTRCSMQSDTPASPSPPLHLQSEYTPRTINYLFYFYYIYIIFAQRFSTEGR